MSDTCAALVLAAGKGTRMYSKSPKVMRRMLGEPMLWYVYDSLERIFGEMIYTVVGFKAEEIAEAFPGRTSRFIMQEQQLGTGHALQVAWERLKADGVTRLLVINGDTPLLNEQRLTRFMEESLERRMDLSFLTLILDDPGSYGRVVRAAADGACAIVEAKDYDPDVHGPETNEINAGIYYMRMAAVEPLLGRLENTNKSKEFYITDLVALAAQTGLKVEGALGGEDDSFLGINTPRELIETEERLRSGIVNQFLDRGAVIHAPGSVRIGPRAAIEPGAELFGPAEVYGATQIAGTATVESHAWIKDAVIRDDAVVHSFCHLEGADVGAGCSVGPFARLRPRAVLEEKAKVGNFVEVKKSVLGKGSKASHLTYLGDAVIGPDVNIGAGTITCNYDGKNKHRTTIKEGSFIGSNTALVAPVEVGKHSLVGAGSVIRHDVPDETVAVARGEQRHYPRTK